MTLGELNNVVKGIGITAEEAYKNLESFAKVMDKLHTPEFIREEIACIKMNPSISWWQKRKLIKNLKIMIKELEEKE